MHFCVLGLKVQLLLLELMEIEEVFLDEDAVAVVEGGFPFFHKTLADFDRQKFSSQILVFLQNLSHFAFNFELGDSPLPLLIFLTLIHSFLRRIHGVSFPFTPIFFSLISFFL